MDIFVGTTYETQSRLYLGTGKGNFTEVTATNLPQQIASVGDIDIGDVDNDGDLDLVLNDWGSGNPQRNKGGRTKLWLNDGTGQFTDVTAASMPDVLVRWSWELELVDVDNDYDLDVLVSCKPSRGSYLFHNDGGGKFTDASSRLPQFRNNYEFEAMDLTGDGFLDLVTVNDGKGYREHIFIADGTESLFPEKANLVGVDDNQVVFLDVESDGDADFIIGSLTGSDRLLRNGGNVFTLEEPVFNGISTKGTLGIAVADLNGDGKLDVVQSEGEKAFDNKVFLGVDIPVDTAAPIIGMVEQIQSITVGSDVIIRARVHDNKSPVMPHDFTSIYVAWSIDSAPEKKTLMSWYGEYLWRVTLPEITGTSIQYKVCATDAQRNEACSDIYSNGSE